VVLLPRRVTYEQIHALLEYRIKSLIELFEPKKPKHQPTEVIMKNFGISLISSNNGIDGRPMLPLESISLGNDAMISIDWDIKAYEDKRLKNKKPVEIQVREEIGSDSSVSLEECLLDFTKEEKLSKNDTWLCPTCQKHQQALKKIDLWFSPKHLVIHLKRFGLGLWGGRKIDRFVTYPLKHLDLTRFVKEYDRLNPPIYDLYAVSNHYGSAFGGHYTAFCKHPDSGDWILFDDKNAKIITNEDDVVSKAGYLLFYKLNEN